MGTWKYIVIPSAEYNEIAAVTSDEALEAVKRLLGPHIRILSVEDIGMDLVYG
jgi:hypothetical protein